MIRDRVFVGAVLVAALSITPGITPSGNYAGAMAQSFSHPKPDHYDPYVGRHNRDGEACCNGSDCRRSLPETVFDILPSGGYRVRANAEGIPEGTLIPEGKVVPEGGPDANWHICMTGSWDGTRWNPKGGRVRCLMIPQGGS